MLILKEKKKGTKMQGKTNCKTSKYSQKNKKIIGKCAIMVGEDNIPLTVHFGNQCTAMKSWNMHSTSCFL